MYRYIQSAAMIMGGWIEADHRMRMYEDRVRLQRRMMQNRAKWERYEHEFAQNKDDEKETPS